MENKRLFIGGLFKDITEETVRERFSKFGTVGSVEIKHKYESSSAGPGEWLKSYAFLDLQTTNQDFNKCVQVLGKTRWKGHSLRIEEAGANFLSTVKNEIAHADAGGDEPPTQPRTKEDGHGTPYPSSQPIIVQSELRGATPGTAVPGVKNWVVTKFARPVPVVYIRRKDKKKVMKYDPSKYCHQLKKLEGKDSAAMAAVDSTSVTSLTWSLPEISNGKPEQLRQPARTAAAVRKKPAASKAGGGSAARAHAASSASPTKQLWHQSSGSDTGLSSDDSSDDDSSSDASGDDVAAAAAAAGSGCTRNSSAASRDRPPRGPPPPSVETAASANVDGHSSDGSDIDIVPMSSSCIVADDCDSGADTDDVLSSQPVAKAAADWSRLSPKVASRTASLKLPPPTLLTPSRSADAKAPTTPRLASSSAVAAAKDRKSKPLTNGGASPPKSASQADSSLPADTRTAPAIAQTAKATKKPPKLAAGKLDAAASKPTLAAAAASPTYSAQQAAAKAEAIGHASAAQPISSAVAGERARASTSAEAALPAVAAPKSRRAVELAGSRHDNGGQAKISSQSGDSTAPAAPSAHPNGLVEGSGDQRRLGTRKSATAKSERTQAAVESNASIDVTVAGIASKSAEVKNAKKAAAARSAVERKAADTAAATKHEVSNQRRLETIKEKQALAKMQQQKIKSALQSLDTTGAQKAKHITFDSDNDENDVEGTDHKVAASALGSDETSLSEPLAKKKAALFESDSDSETGMDYQTLEKAFEPKPQFEGKKGEKLMKMQARFDNDERFRLTELFKEDEASEDSDEGRKEDAEVATLSDEKVSVEVSSKAEKQRNLSILRGIVGNKRVKVFDAPKSRTVAVAPNMLMTRYDPTDTQHKSLELTVEPKKKKPRKSQHEENDDAAAATVVLPPAPEVSKDRFFDVHGSLADLFAKKEAAPFSFFDDSGTVGKPSLGGSNHAAAIDLQAAQPWMQKYPEPRDSSDEDDDDDDVAAVLLGGDAAGDSRHAVKPTESGRPITALVDSFFFVKDDPRLDEGRQFCRSLTPEELRERWLQGKEELTQDYRQQRKRVLRKLRGRQDSSAAPPWKRQPFAGADRRRRP